VSDAEKEIYLFKRRNDYAHKADFRPPGGEWLGRSYVNPVQEFHTDHWTTIRTIGWPEILDKVVRVGLARYLLRSQEEQKSSRIAPAVNKERRRERDDRQNAGERRTECGAEESRSRQRRASELMELLA
jgi:hypothetical protein